jgi:hypothetical protein
MKKTILFACLFLLLVTENKAQCTGMASMTVSVTDCSTATNSHLPKGVKLSVSPNPNNGNFVFSGKLNETTPLSITVFDVLGQPIYSEKMEAGIEFSRNLGLKSIPAGAYWLTVRTDKWLHSLPFIVE